MRWEFVRVSEKYVRGIVLCCDTDRQGDHPTQVVSHRISLNVSKYVKFIFILFNFLLYAGLFFTKSFLLMMLTFISVVDAVR